ncbi:MULTISPECIES: MFS transporter [Solibacillus]|uniref:MFS transporter n=1 Tax=Solibacillus merdavium TaxID=2762218 RepID=A0ABR8XLR4_9BACL|nr:MFS transporter [Solibacillus merdavium]MBD8032846.1 MFS transporter [Solibacillus merdavium]
MNLLKNPNFQKLYVISLLVNISMTTFSFILPLILYEYTKSAIAMSTMRLMDFLPNVLLGMFIGVLVDRMNRRLTMLWGNVIRTLFAFTLTVVLTTTEFSLWSVYVLGFVISSLGYMIGSATNAIMPQLFERSQMTEIQTRLSLQSTLISIIGPGLLGMLLLWSSNAVFLWLFVGCNLLIVFVTALLQKVPNPKRSSQSLWQDLKEGYDELIRNKSLFIQTWTIFFSNFASSLIIGVLTFYALDTLQFTKEELGFMLTLSAFGGILGAKIIRPLRNKYRRGQIYTYSMAVEVLILITFMFAQTWWLLGILLALRTAISTMTNIVYLALRQETTPNHLLGRVAGTTSMIMKLALPFGLLVGGYWADHFAIPPIFLISAIIISINVFILFKTKFTKTV